MVIFSISSILFIHYEHSGSHSGAAGIMFKDAYITALTVTPGFLFATPYSLSTERKATLLRFIHSHYTVQCKAKFRSYTECIQNQGKNASRSHQSGLTHLKMLKLSDYRYRICMDRSWRTWEKQFPGKTFWAFWDKDKDCNTPHRSHFFKWRKKKKHSIVFRKSCVLCLHVHTISALPCGWGRYRGRPRSPAFLWQSVCLLSNNCLHSCLPFACVCDTLLALTALYSGIPIYWVLHWVCV